MIDYVFTKAHTLDRVLYQPGDEIQRTPRLGDWLIEQGVPLRRKEGQVARPPPVVTAKPSNSRPVFAPPSNRFKCCGWK